MNQVEPFEGPTFPIPLRVQMDQPLAPEPEHQDGVVFMQDNASPEDKKKSFMVLHVIGEIFLFLLFMVPWTLH